LQLHCKGSYYVRRGNSQRTSLLTNAQESNRLYANRALLTGPFLEVNVTDQVLSGEYVTFVAQGGIPVTVVRYGGTYVRITSYGGKQVTYVKYGGAPITVDTERELPEEVKEEMGY